MSLFKALLIQFARMFYKDNCDPQSLLQFLNENTIILRDLMKD